MPSTIFILSCYGCFRLGMYHAHHPGELWERSRQWWRWYWSLWERAPATAGEGSRVR